MMRKKIREYSKQTPLASIAPSSTLNSVNIAPTTNDTIVVVEKASKAYRLYSQPQDRLKHALLWRFGRQIGREFWALRDVSFQIRGGEAVGIIGQNGSGKSTLLQIIAGTIAPTTGQVRVKGRVAALLELGSGFNPEFTGRENVFLNGVILGLTYAEMEERIDDILMFADIGNFIDQPVKVYSSGMVLRLAFAVQVVIKKDVLIVDEALAVGDEAFQRKCMRALEQFRAGGGTVLLVSHSAQTIVRQCSRCLFLNNGQLVLDGPSKPVTDIYQRFVLSAPQQKQETLDLIRAHASAPAEELRLLLARDSKHLPTSPTHISHQSRGGWDPRIPATVEIAYGSGQAEIYDFGIYDDLEQRVNILVAGQSCTWRYKVSFHETVYEVSFGMMLKTVDGVDVAGTNNSIEGIHIDKIMVGSEVEVNFRLRMNVGEGVYYFNSGVAGLLTADADEKGYLHRRIDVCAVRVIPPDTRQVYGLAYLEPKVDIRYISS